MRPALAVPVKQRLWRGWLAQRQNLPGEDLRKAVKNALKRLEKSTCSGLLGMNAASMLERLSNGRIIYEDLGVASDIALTPVAQYDPARDAILINSSGWFDKPTKWKHGGNTYDSLTPFQQATGYKVNESEYREAFLLHELGHATGALVEDDIVSDPNGTLSFGNTLKVLKTCFKK